MDKLLKKVLPFLFIGLSFCLMLFHPIARFLSKTEEDSSTGAAIIDFIFHISCIICAIVFYKKITNKGTIVKWLFYVAIAISILWFFIFWFMIFAWALKI